MGELPEVGNQSDLGQILQVFFGDRVGVDVVDVLPQNQLPQGFHDAGQVDSAGTAYLAGVAGRTEPDRLGLKGFFDLPQLDPANDMAGHHIHGLYAGTAGRTLAALVAGQEVLLA